MASSATRLANSVAWRKHGGSPVVDAEMPNIQEIARHGKSILISPIYWVFMGYKL